MPLPLLPSSLSSTPLPPWLRVSALPRRAPSIWFQAAAAVSASSRSELHRRSAQPLFGCRSASVDLLRARATAAAAPSRRVCQHGSTQSRRDVVKLR
jgi:hypothetical protein